MRLFAILLFINIPLSLCASEYYVSPEYTFRKDLPCQFVNLNNDESAEYVTYREEDELLLFPTENTTSKWEENVNDSEYGEGKESTIIITTYDHNGEISFIRHFFKMNSTLYEYGKSGIPLKLVKTDPPEICSTRKLKY